MSPLFFLCPPFPWYQENAPEALQSDFDDVRNIIDTNVAMWRNILIVTVAVGTGILIGCLMRGNQVPEKPSIVHKDTTIVIDTNIYVNPIPVSFDIVVDASITVPRADITIVDDSLIVLPMQTRTYAGDDYRLQISGYRPNLDWIETFPQTRYVTTTVADKSGPTRWGIGIQAGYGIGVNSGQVTAFPYIGVGLSYNILRF